MSGFQSELLAIPFAEDFDLVFAPSGTGKSWISKRVNKFIDGDKLYKFPGTEFWRDDCEKKRVNKEWAESVFTYLTKRDESDRRTVLMAWNPVLLAMLEARKGFKIGIHVPDESDVSLNVQIRQITEKERPQPSWIEVLFDLNEPTRYLRSIEHSELPRVYNLSSRTECILGKLVFEHLGAYLDSPGGLSRLMLNTAIIAVDDVVNGEDLEPVAGSVGFDRVVVIKVGLTGFSAWGKRKGKKKTVGEVAILSDLIEQFLVQGSQTLFILSVNVKGNPVLKQRFIECASIATLSVSSTPLSTWSCSLTKYKCFQHPTGCCRPCISNKVDLHLAIKQSRCMVSIVENVCREVVVADDELRSKLIDALPGYVHTMQVKGVQPISSVRLLSNLGEASSTPISLPREVHSFIEVLAFITQVIPWNSIPWDLSRVTLRPICETGREGRQWLEMLDSGKVSVCAHRMSPWKIRYAMLTKPPGTVVSIEEGTELPFVTEGVSGMTLCDDCIARLRADGVDDVRLSSLSKID